MTKDTLKIASLTSLIALAPLAAIAQLNVGNPVGTDEASIRTALETAGYEVVDIEFEDDEIEAEVLLNGEEFEIEIAADGTILEVEAEDEDDD